MSLGLDYKFRPGIGLLAKYQDAEDAPHNWRKTLLPSVDAAAREPGELQLIIAAIDEGWARYEGAGVYSEHSVGEIPDAYKPRN